jgi:hypothetical protein
MPVTSPAARSRRVRALGVSGRVDVLAGRRARGPGCSRVGVLAGRRATPDLTVTVDRRMALAAFAA